MRQKFDSAERPTENGGAKVIYRLASFDSASDLGPDSRKQSANNDEQHYQMLLQQILAKNDGSLPAVTSDGSAMVRTELLRCGCLIITSPMHDATTNSLLSVNTQSNPTVVLNPTFDFTASTPIPEEEDDDQSDRIQLICDDQDDDIPTSSTPCQNVSCASDTPETTRLSRTPSQDARIRLIKRGAAGNNNNATTPNLTCSDTVPLLLKDTTVTVEEQTAKHTTVNDSTNSKRDSSSATTVSSRSAAASHQCTTTSSSSLLHPPPRASSDHRHHFHRCYFHEIPPHPHHTHSNCYCNTPQTSSTVTVNNESFCDFDLIESSSSFPSHSSHLTHSSSFHDHINNDENYCQLPLKDQFTEHFFQQISDNNNRSKDSAALIPVTDCSIHSSHLLHRFEKMPFATQLRTKTKTQQLNIQQSKQASKHSESSKSTSQAPPNDLDSPEVAHVEPTAVYQPITLNFSYTTAPSCCYPTDSAPFITSDHPQLSSHCQTTSTDSSNYHLLSPCLDTNVPKSLAINQNCSHISSPFQKQLHSHHHSSPSLNSYSFKYECSMFEQLNKLSADIAAENPDMIHFQQVLNKWIRSQTNSRLVAFLLVSRECNACFCQVAGEHLLKEAVNCGDASVLYRLFPRYDSSDRTNSTSDDEIILPPPYSPDASPIFVDIKSLDQAFRSKLHAIAVSVDGGRAVKVPIDAFCATIILLQARCGFVAGLLMVHQNERTKESERQAIAPHLTMIGTLLSIVVNVEEQKRLARQSQIFLTMAQNVFSSLQDMNLLVRNITKEAKTLVHAETCSLFLLDKEHSELVAEVFEKNGTSDEYLTEIRMPLSKGIVGHVASTGQMMNVDDVYNHPFFYPKVDERTGFVTRNILCFPIKDSSGNLVGVAELCNKIGKQAFTRHDEQIATTFAVYCAISISHCLLYRKLQEAHRRSHMAAELLVQGSTLSIAPEDILRFTVRDIPASTSFHPDFTQFFFIPRSIGAGDTYIEASLSMFKELQFIEQFRLRRRTLARFLLMVQKGYRDVPYHNWSHAFAVGHFCFLLVRTAAVRNALTDLERLSLFVACLCHDIDHRGTTNAFQLQSKTPLAQLYSSEGSVLERHHFAQTVSILSMEECNIFDQLNRQQYQTVLDNIREIILATDIAAHLRKVDRIKKMVEDGYDRTSNEHHYLLMCLLMTAADLSDQSKDFKNSKAIAENIYKEFFSQGDLEKQMGNRPLEMMDRDRACVPKIQLEFMDTVALPVFDYVSRILPDVKGTYNAILLNRRCWHVLDQILKEEGLPRGGLDYLRNVDLDEKVMKRIAEEDDKQR